MRAKLAGRSCLLAVALALAARAPAGAARPTAITDIRQESSDRSTRLVVECTGPLAYTYYSPDPLTLVVDIPEVDASKVPARINVGTREVESVRVTNLARADGRNLARLEVRLASLVPVPDLLEGQGAQPGLRAPGDASQRRDARAAPRQRRAAAGGRRLRPAGAAAGAGSGRRRGSRLAAAEPGSERAAPERPAGDAHPRRQPRRDAARCWRSPCKADGRLRYQDFFLRQPRPPGDRLRGRHEPRADAHARGQPGPGAQGAPRPSSAPTSPKVARLVAGPVARASPYRIVEGADGVQIVFGEGGGRGGAPRAGPGPRAARRAPRARARRQRSSRRRGRGAARSRSIRCADAGVARAAGRGASPTRRRRSRAGEHRPGVRPEGRTPATRSAWTSRTATCRTSSASSPTSAA